MKKQIISALLAFSLLISVVPVFIIQPHAAQPDGGAINWNDYYFVDASTIISYAVDGGNLYFGNNTWDDEQTRSTEIVMFGNDSTVSDIVIPETIDGRTVTSIDMTFPNSQAKTVALPKTIRSLGEGCFLWEKLEYIGVAADNPYFYSVDGVVFSSDSPSYIAVYPAAKKQSTFSIPEGIEHIDFYQFASVHQLTKIGIPVSAKWFSSAYWDGTSYITDIYYAGTKEQWQKINGYKEADAFNARIHYESTLPNQEVPDTEQELTGWRKAYFDYIVADKQNTTYQNDWQYVDYALIYLDSDSIPEIWITYQSTAQGSKLLSYHSGYVTQTVMSQGGLYYEEYKNTFYHSFGRMGHYSDVVYCLKNGIPEQVAVGEYTEIVNNGAIAGYSYVWNNDSLSEAAYINHLNTYVDPNLKKDAGTIQYNYDEILSQLEQLEQLFGSTTSQPITFNITTDHTSLCIRQNNKILLGAGLFSNGHQVGNVSGITFQIEDSSILEVSASFAKDNYLYASFNALKEGATNVIFSDSDSGAVAIIPMTVYSNNYLCYTLSSVPTQQIEKYPTNFYNVNGLYVDSYTYTVNADQSASVSFDVYNSNYTYGTVEVYDVNGNLKNAVLINKMGSSMTSMKEVLWDDVVYLVRDIHNGDLLSYRQESGFSKKTPISVTIPENGYLKICNDPENSFIVSLVNSADLLLSLASFMGEVKNYDVNSTYFLEKLTTKLVNEKIFAECVKDGSKLSKKLWSNIGTATISSPTALATSCDTLAQNISELELEDLIISTAMDFGINVGEETFTYFAGPFGTALKAIFAIGKMENILVQHTQMTKSAGIGSIYIQNQGGGILGSQQITVESESGFEPDTALRVFSVTINPDMLSKIETTNPKLYEAIVGKSSYTYDISLLKNGDATQPGDKVTVCIPIPAAWRIPMPNDLKESIYSGIFKIYRIEKNGITTEMPIDVKGECFVFETDHFSLYTLAKYDIAQSNENAGLSTDSFMDWMIPIIITIGICCSALVLGCVLKSKKKKCS